VPSPWQLSQLWYCHVQSRSSPPSILTALSVRPVHTCVGPAPCCSLLPHAFTGEHRLRLACVPKSSALGTQHVMPAPGWRRLLLFLRRALVFLHPWQCTIHGCTETEGAACTMRSCTISTGQRNSGKRKKEKKSLRRPQAAA